MTITSRRPGEADQDVVLRELHHRFYNSLQVISSMANTLLRDDPHSAAIRKVTVGRLQDRIALLAGIHRLLAEPLATGQQLGPSCRQLCDSLTSAFDRPDAALTLSIGTFAIEPAAGRGILLLIVELVTNALKHSPSDHRVLISVSLRSCELNYELAVSSNTARWDACAGPPRVATHLAESLGGTLQVSARSNFKVNVILPKSTS